MNDFQVRILGCGSALPAGGRHPSAQHVKLGKYQMLIDCGEGTQMRMREQHLKLQSLTHIFISHMHGDHYLGLMGLLFSMTLLGRDKPLRIIGPKELEELIEVHLRHAKAGLRFEIEFTDTAQAPEGLLLDLPGFTVHALKLDHKVLTHGFLFQEKPRPRKLIGAKLEAHKVPIKLRKALTLGEDFMNEDGELVPNSELTEAPLPPKSYAYCSDTAYRPALVERLSAVDVIYHESTFVQADVDRAHRTRHSTAREAAMIAKAAGAKQLLLGHYSARYKNLDKLLAEAQAVFPQSVLSEEGMCIDIHSF